MKNHFRWIALSFLVTMLATPTLVYAQEFETIVPGHSKERYDQDDNGIPDVGVVTTGKYESLFAYDSSGNYYWDLGDGRVQGTVGSVDDLDQGTLTACTYQVVFRGEFNNDPFLDTGWISNMINCVGYEHGAFHYQIVHETDPRYTGNPEFAVWGTWEYHVLTESGAGNQVTRYLPGGGS